MYFVILAAIGLSLITLLMAKYRKLPITVWRPGAAWLRAGIYFLVCNVVSAATGTLTEILEQPVIGAGQVLLSMYHLWQSTSLPERAVYLLSFATMGLWMYIVQDYFWDIYVSPEHEHFPVGTHKNAGVSRTERDDMPALPVFL